MAKVKYSVGGRSGERRGAEWGIAVERAYTDQFPRSLFDNLVYFS